MSLFSELLSPARGGGSSLRERITAATLSTALAVLLVGCVLFVFEARQAERHALKLEAAHLSAVLAGPEADALFRGDKGLAQALLAPLARVPSVRSAVLSDARGGVIAAIGSQPSPAQAERQRLILARQAILRGPSRLGELTILSRPPAIANLMPRYLAMAAGLFFVAAGLALFLGGWLASRITDPVQRLSAAMRQVADSRDFDRVVERPSDEALGVLTDSFNGLLATLHAYDLELRQTMAELIQKRDEAEAGSRTKSQFLANMSHEIRTPLNGVLAMAQVMDMGELSPPQREKLTIIRQSGEALLTLLNDVLDVSKIEAGKLELETIRFDPEAVVRGVQAGFAALAEKKGVALVVQVDPAAAGARLGDESRFRQIVNNLISNAVKFTERGEVRVILTPDSSSEGLRLVVSDTGMGIAPEKLPLLFDKFSQLDSSTTRKFGGTGLGLAICQDLALLMGGRIWVESTEGVGSSFHLKLPLAFAPRVETPEPEIEAEAPAETGDDRPLRVLAAEDNPTNQVVLTTVMQIFGVELVLAGDGAVALQAWREGVFDVILMDVQMPVMDGIAATRAIRAEEAETGRARTPIIALSANAMTHQVQEYLAAGMDAHVAKPIELPKLQAALEAAVTDREDRAAA